MLSKFHVAHSPRWLAVAGAMGLTLALAPGAVAQLPEIPAEETSPTEPTEPVADDVRFSCQSVNGEYTVMYHPDGQDGQGYAWATPTALGGGWTPERRCSEISRRLESYRPDGLSELGTNVENGYDVVCVTTQENSSCRIVLTVPPGQDPRQTRDLVFENIVLADSGTSTDGVTALTGSDGVEIVEGLLGIELPEGLGGRRSSQPSRQRTSSNWIDLRPFLAPTDGGTGGQLQNFRGSSPSPSPENPQLDPSRF
ncbi:COP23 domain-containing protein [Sodalinema gerasimenkoae]|uniref:COP23 domain-containing protein n=1 Tax=Sodalinema gerasimenkoae TaxID=2862348 RepID=UPI0018657218|nr:COP23 domain-containing protein [Sodalinema gerasimenkoae]